VTSLKKIFAGFEGTALLLLADEDDRSTSMVRPGRCNSDHKISDGKWLSGDLLAQLLRFGPNSCALVGIIWTQSTCDVVLVLFYIQEIMQVSLNCV
jgi:hypothetical protein